MGERLQHGLEVLALTSTGAKSRSSRTVAPALGKAAAVEQRAPLPTG